MGFKFFSLTQDPGESQEKFVTDLKLLGATCNFDDLKDSLVRDRIICGIQDRQLREELIRIPDLDLQRSLSICRAAELSKTRTKTLEEGEAVNSLKTKRSTVRCQLTKAMTSLRPKGGKMMIGTREMQILRWKTSCCQEKLPSVREEVFGLRKNESFRFSMPF